MLNPKDEFDIRLGGDRIAQWTPPANLRYFDGHFPNNPILPAVAIIDVSIEILRRALQRDYIDVKTIKSCKFMNPILPNMAVEIAFTQKNADEWSFEWKSAAEPQTALAQLIFEIA